MQAKLHHAEKRCASENLQKQFSSTEEDKIASIGYYLHYIWCSNNMVLIIKDSCSSYSSILNFLLLEGGASENVGQTNVVGQTLICLIFWLFGQLQFFGQLIHIQNCQGLELMVSILCVRLWYHITYTYLINLRATAPHSVTL